MKNLILLIISFLNLLSLGFSANILYYVGLLGPSHQVAVWPILEKMGTLGHKITILSPYRPNNSSAPNVIQFIPKEYLKYTKNFQVSSAEGYLARVEKRIDYLFWDTIWKDDLDLCEIILKSPETQSWIKRSSFDLVMMDSLFNECAIGLAYKFSAQFIRFSATSLLPWQFESEGFLPDNLLPDIQFHYHRDMTFYQRLVVTLRPFYWEYVRQYLYYPRLDKILQEHLNETNIPPMIDFEKESALLLVNSHFSNEFARSFPPNVIEVGGMHCKEATGNLPNDIKDFIELNENGFIYFSLGSFVLFKDLPEKVFNTFYSFIKKNRQINFLWKFEGEFTKEIPKNLMIKNWFPQQEILAHPKILGFISQGGQPSFQEATFHGVPIIFFPILWDQDFNAEMGKYEGYGIVLEIVEVTEEKLDNALNAILNDSRYKNRAKEVSRLFKDRMNSPTETAVWWIEYSMRNREHLESIKPIGYKLNMWKRKNLDIWAFIFVVITMSLAFLGYCLLNFQKIILSRSTTDTRSPDNKKQQ